MFLSCFLSDGDDGVGLGSLRLERSVVDERGREGECVDVVGLVGVGLGEGYEDERLEVEGGQTLELVGHERDGVEELEVARGGRTTSQLRIGDGYGDGTVGYGVAMGYLRELEGVDVDKSAGELDGRLLVGELVPVAADIADLRAGVLDEVDDGVDY